MLRSLKWIDPEKVFIFLFSTNITYKTNEFTILPMGLTEVGAAISEVSKNGNNAKKGCNIFLTNLSMLIHVFGTYPCYNLILNKMGEIRQADIELFGFIYPETHNDKSVIPLFTNISDKVIEI